MTKYRVFYHRGSFALADLCESYNEAVARALRLRSQRGVWQVGLEEVESRRIINLPGPAGPRPGPMLVWRNRRPKRAATNGDIAMPRRAAERGGT